MITTAVIVLILGLIAELTLPWWGMGLAAFLAGLWKAPSGWKSLCAGFAGTGLLWLTAAGYIHLKSGGILTIRVAQIAGLSTPDVLIVLTALIGGLVGGLAAVAGFHFRPLIRRNQNA